MNGLASKKLFLIYHGRFPGEKAASLFTAKSAEAFADAGFEVVVLAPRRLARSRKTPQEYFGVKNNFRTVYLPIVDFFGLLFLRKFAFLKSYATFSISVFFYLLLYTSHDDIIYSNESLSLLLSSYVRKDTFLEVHDFPSHTFLHRRLFHRVRGIVATNRWKRDELIRRFGIKPERILYEPNAVDAFRFGDAIGSEVRQRLPLPTGTVLIGYAGTLKTMGMEKGIQVLLEALALLPPRFRCLIIGGLREDIETYRASAQKLGIADRVVFTGWMHYDSIPEHLAACDVLVAPFPKTEHYDYYMSPMKLFEYMAVGKPIVASRLHSISEIVDEESAFLVDAGNAQALANGIQDAAGNASARARAARARAIAKEHTWSTRAMRIIAFLQNAY